MTYKTPTAALLYGPEPMLLPARHRKTLYVAVGKGSALETYAKINFPADNVIAFSAKKKRGGQLLSYDETVRDTNLAGIMRDKGIEYFLIPHQYTPVMRGLASRGFKMLATSLGTQRIMENKLLFDRMLKKYGISSPRSMECAVLPGADTEKTAAALKKRFGETKTYVMQIEKRETLLYSTRYYRSPDQLARAMRAARPGKTLIREYIDGMPLGASIFLDGKGNVFFSGLRRQCFTLKDGFPYEFLGVQWMPWNMFSPKAQAAVTATLQSLAAMFIKERFCGVANIDFMLSRDLPYVLECNPRPSLATSHVFSVPGLATHADPWEFFCNTFWNIPNKKIRDMRLPLSKFDGAALDIEIKPQNYATIRNILPVGIYRLRNRRVKFLNPRAETFLKEEKAFLLAHEFTKPMRVHEEFVLCSLVSNFPLFRYDTGELNEDGALIHSFILRSFLA